MSTLKNFRTWLLSSAIIVSSSSSSSNTPFQVLGFFSVFQPSRGLSAYLLEHYVISFSVIHNDMASLFSNHRL